MAVQKSSTLVISLEGYVQALQNQWQLTLSGCLKPAFWAES
jgi:hypothetical protein